MVLGEDRSHVILRPFRYYYQRSRLSDPMNHLSACLISLFQHLSHFFVVVFLYVNKRGVYTVYYLCFLFYSVPSLRLNSMGYLCMSFMTFLTFPCKSSYALMKCLFLFSNVENWKSMSLSICVPETDINGSDIIGRFVFHFIKVDLS